MIAFSPIAVVVLSSVPSNCWSRLYRNKYLPREEMHSLNVMFFKTCYVLGTILAFGDTAMNEIEIPALAGCYFSEKGDEIRGLSSLHPLSITEEILLIPRLTDDAAETKRG